MYSKLLLTLVLLFALNACTFFIPKEYETIPPNKTSNIIINNDTIAFDIWFDKNINEKDSLYAYCRTKNYVEAPQLLQLKQYLNINLFIHNDQLTSIILFLNKHPQTFQPLNKEAIIALLFIENNGNKMLATSIEKNGDDFKSGLIENHAIPFISTNDFYAYGEFLRGLFNTKELAVIDFTNSEQIINKNYGTPLFQFIELQKDIKPKE